jgi:hypothetical protein
LKTKKESFGFNFCAEPGAFAARPFAGQYQSTGTESHRDRTQERADGAGIDDGGKRATRHAPADLSNLPAALTAGDFEDDVCLLAIDAIKKG